MGPAAKDQISLNCMTLYRSWRIAILDCICSFDGVGNFGGDRGITTAFGVLFSTVLSLGAADFCVVVDS